MVFKLWNNTKIYCAKHLPEQKEMVISTKGKMIYYVCPECGNKITSTDFEKILNEVSKIHVTRSKNAEWGKIAGEKFKVNKTINCEVIEQTEDEKYSISVLNTRPGVTF